MGGVRPKGNSGSKRFQHDTLSKYLKADMPEVHDAHVSALFELVDLDQLAIIPFGIEIDSKEQLQNTKDLILATVTDITQSQTLGVSAPVPNQKALTLKRHPTTFLAYDLTEEHCQTLLKHRIWSSPELTFRVAPTDPCRPKFLFTIGDFTTNNISKVQELVARVWKDEESHEFFNSLTQAMDMDDTPTEPPITHNEIKAFLASLHISLIKLLVHVPSPTPENPKATTPTLKPRFNIYADSEHIRDFQNWTDIRNFLASRPYQTAALGQGTTHIAPHNCGICHGADHPRGLCPFPGLPGGVAPNAGQRPTEEEWKWTARRNTRGPKGRESERGDRRTPQRTFP